MSSLGIFTHQGHISKVGSLASLTHSLTNPGSIASHDAKNAHFGKNNLKDTMFDLKVLSESTIVDLFLTGQLHQWKRSKRVE